MVFLRRDRFSAVRVKDKWVVHGGISGVTCGKSTNSTFVYNFASRSWTQLESSLYNPKSRANHSCAVFGENHVVFCGGREDWNGRNPSLSSPCIPAESLRLLEDSAGPSLEKDQAILGEAKKMNVQTFARKNQINVIKKLLASVVLTSEMSTGKPFKMKIFGCY